MKWREKIPLLIVGMVLMLPPVVWFVAHVYAMSYHTIDFNKVFPSGQIIDMEKNDQGMILEIGESGGVLLKTRDLKRYDSLAFNFGEMSITQDVCRMQSLPLFIDILYRNTGSEDKKRFHIKETVYDRYIALTLPLTASQAAAFDEVSVLFSRSTSNVPLTLSIRKIQGMKRLPFLGKALRLIPSSVYKLENHLQAYFPWVRLQFQRWHLLSFYFIYALFCHLLYQKFTKRKDSVAKPAIYIMVLFYIANAGLSSMKVEWTLANRALNAESFEQKFELVYPYKFDPAFLELTDYIREHEYNGYTLIDYSGFEKYYLHNRLYPESMQIIGSPANNQYLVIRKGKPAEEGHNIRHFGENYINVY